MTSYSLISYRDLFYFIVSELVTTPQLLMTFLFDLTFLEYLVTYRTLVVYSSEPSSLLNSYLHGGVVRDVLLLTWGSDSPIFGRDW
jgi:hypothetical protein